MMQNGMNRVVCLLSGPLAAVGRASAQSPVGVEGELVSLPLLDADAERASLESALREGCAESGRAIELQIRYATLDALRSAVTLGARVVHFSGHGHPSFLCFEDGRGGAAAASPEQLRRLVSAGGTGVLRLVVVNSCHSQQAGSAFVEAGVPHVVAVSCSANSDGRVSDKAATAFCRAFYLGVIAGRTVRQAFDIGSASASGNDGTYVLLPEDSSHDERIFVDAPTGPLRVVAPRRTPTNAPAMPTYCVGRDAELFCLVDAMLRHRLTSVTGSFGSGKSALAAIAAHYIANRGHHFEAVVWVKVNSRERLVEDVVEAVRRVLSVPASSDDQKDDSLQQPAAAPSSSSSRLYSGNTGAKFMSLRRRRSSDSSEAFGASQPPPPPPPSPSTQTDQQQVLSPSPLSSGVERVASFSSLIGGTLADEDDEDGGGAVASRAAATTFLCNKKVLIVLDDLEKIAAPRLNAVVARANTQRALNSLLANASKAHVVVTCSRGSGLGRSTSVTEHVVKVSPLEPRQAAKLLLLRSPELARRATNVKAARSPRSPPDALVASAAAHPVVRRLVGNPLAIALSATLLNSLFEAEDLANAAARAAMAHSSDRLRASVSEPQVNAATSISFAENSRKLSSTSLAQLARPLEPLDRLLNILEQSSSQQFEDGSLNETGEGEIGYLRDDINAVTSQQPLESDIEESASRTQLSTSSSCNELFHEAGADAGPSHQAFSNTAGYSLKTSKTSLTLAGSLPPPSASSSMIAMSSIARTGTKHDATPQQHSRERVIDRQTFNIFATALGVVWIARLFFDAFWPPSSPLALRLDAVAHLFIDIALLAVLASLLPSDDAEAAGRQR